MRPPTAAEVSKDVTLPAIGDGTERDLRARVLGRIAAPDVPDLARLSCCQLARSGRLFCVAGEGRAHLGEPCVVIL
jgi:hypothetical protein